MAGEAQTAVMQPGEDIKPRMTKEDAAVLLKEVFGLEGGTITELDGYDDLNYHCLSPKMNKNPNIKEIWRHGYVLKVMNSLDSKNVPLTEAQIEIILFLKDRNITVPTPVKNLKNQYYSLEKLPLGKSEQKEHTVRLFEFLPGKILKSISANYSLYYQAGKLLAKMDELLTEFHHPIYDTHRSIWHLASAPQLESFLYVVENPQRKQMVEEILDSFSQNVLAKTDTLQGGIIHGDFNEQNIIVDQWGDGEWRVSGVLDFGDACLSNYLFELAISMCYIMLDCKRNGLDPIIGSGHILAGYKIVQPTANFDTHLLKISVATRLCQSLVLGLYTHKLHPENDYVFYNQKMGWPLLTELWSMPIEIVNQMWDSVLQSYKN